jgi:hypothetical protein
LVNHGDEVAEMGGTGVRLEVSMLLDELLEPVEERQAPSGGSRSGNALSGDIDVHRRRVGEH